MHFLRAGQALAKRVPRAQRRALLGLPGRQDAQSGGVVLLGSGFLMDYVIKPGMRADGWLSPWVTPLYGTGQGRGIAFVISLLGLATLAFALLAWMNRSVRQLDTLLEDFETPILEEDAILKAQPPH